MKNKHKSIFCFLVSLSLFALALQFTSCNASAQDKVTRINFSPEVEDYSVPIRDALQDLYDNGGGTLELGYGIYPLAIEMFFSPRGKAIHINVRGIKNPAGQRPILKCVSAPGTTHMMLHFETGYTDRFTLDISSLEIEGNNVPVNRAASNVEYDNRVEPWLDTPEGLRFLSNIPPEKNYGHPFLFHNGANGSGIHAANVATVKIDDVEVREIYGNGIVIIASGDGPG